MELIGVDPSHEQILHGSYEMVEVPDTACPLTQEQIDLLPATGNMNYLEGVETLQQIFNIV